MKNDNRSSDERQRQQDEVKSMRYTPEVEKGLRQFLTLETGQGKSSAYRRGHEYAFDFTDVQKEAVTLLMKDGMTFDEAFDAVKAKTPEVLRAEGR